MNGSKNKFSILKNYFPPFFLNQMQYAKAYVKFLQYKKFVKNNSELKNTHKGQRCFLLGSGKSIDHEDISVLKDEIIILYPKFTYSLSNSPSKVKIHDLISRTCKKSQ